MFIAVVADFRCHCNISVAKTIDDDYLLQTYEMKWLEKFYTNVAGYKLNSWLIYGEAVD
jgi:hypothetical protein